MKTREPTMGHPDDIPFIVGVILLAWRLMVLKPQILGMNGEQP